MQYIALSRFVIFIIFVISFTLSYGAIKLKIFIFNSHLFYVNTEKNLLNIAIFILLKH